MSDSQKQWTCMNRFLLNLTKLVKTWHQCIGARKPPPYMYVTAETCIYILAAVVLRRYDFYMMFVLNNLEVANILYFLLEAETKTFFTSTIYYFRKGCSFDPM
jgi:hypothetical protein